jgi:8-amino-7-oxononanoate synthase
MSYLQQIASRLGEIRALRRYREIAQPRTYAADFSRNDYLSLANDSRMLEALKRAKSVGAGGARLLGGNDREHALLEGELAAWLGRERALLFSSGYLAALGAIPVLGGFADRIYSDELNHAGLIDAIRFSKRPRVVYPHAALPPREAADGCALVVTESLFGMDGDTIDVRAVLGSLGADDVLLVDEAHAIGTLGVEGAGLARGIDDPRIVVLGTLGKALGAAGGFIAGPEPVVDLLINSARTFIFDTALPPAIAFAARIGLMLARNAGDRRARLQSAGTRLRAGLRALNAAVPDTGTPIVPVILGSEDRAMEAMRTCLERGVYAPAVRPPTVPPGSSRLRISLNAGHTAEQIDLLLESLRCSGIS